MPLNSKGEKIMENMQQEYGDKEGESVFYASKNAHAISGVDAILGLHGGNSGGLREVYGPSHGVHCSGVDAILKHRP